MESLMYSPKCLSTTVSGNGQLTLTYVVSWLNVSMHCSYLWGFLHLVVFAGATACQVLHRRTQSAVVTQQRRQQLWWTWIHDVSCRDPSSCLGVCSSHSYLIFLELVRMSGPFHWIGSSCLSTDSSLICILHVVDSWLPLEAWPPS